MTHTSVQIMYLSTTSSKNFSVSLYSSNVLSLLLILKLLNYLNGPVYLSFLKLFFINFPDNKIKIEDGQPTVHSVVSDCTDV